MPRSPDVVVVTNVGARTVPVRSVVKVGNYWFVFYSPASGSNAQFICYKSSSDGINWGDETLASDGTVLYWASSGWTVRVYGDEIYLVYSRQSDNKPRFRKGTQSDGVITWSITTTLEPSETSSTELGFNVCQTSGGYIYISYDCYLTRYTIFCFKSTDDGSSFTEILKTTTGVHIGYSTPTIIVPNTLVGSNAIMLLWHYAGQKFMYSLYDGTTWTLVGVGVPNSTANGTFIDNACSAVAHNGVIHLVHVRDSSGSSAKYQKYTGSWSTETVIEDAICQSPSLSLCNDFLYLLYKIGGTTKYYWRRMDYSNYSWSSPTLLIDDGAIGNNYLITDEYPNQSSYFGFTWIRTTTPNRLVFAYFIPGVDYSIDVNLREPITEWALDYHYRKRHIIGPRKAKRFYCPNVGPVDISPAFSAQWEKTADASRVLLAVDKTRSAFAPVSSSETSAEAPYDVLLRQYISPPIKAQTISGSVKGQIRALESSTDADMCRAMVIKVVSGDGSTVRGTLLNHFPESLTSEFATLYTNRKFPPPSTLTPVEAQEGDRIVIEIGYRAFNTSGTSYLAALELGDGSPTDLPEDEFTTSIFCPWIEFSKDIEFVSNAGTDYQIKIKVNYGSGTDSGENVYLSGKCRTDFSDIRFTSSDGSTLLSYWIEETVVGSYAIFWVKIPDLSNITTVFIYYGNPGATTMSNGDNTFIFGDDFSGTSLDTNKWLEAGTGTIEVSDGYIRIKTTASSGTKRIMELADRDLANTKLITRWRPRYTTSQSNEIIYVNYIDLWYLGRMATEKINLYTRSSGAWGKRWESATTYPYNVWYKLHLLIMPSVINVVSYNDNYTLKDQSGRALYDSGTQRLTLRQFNINDEGDWDYVWIAKFVDPEPEHRVWGPEVIGPVALYISDVVLQKLALSNYNTDVLILQTLVSDYLIDCLLGKEAEVFSLTLSETITEIFDVLFKTLETKASERLSLKGLFSYSLLITYCTTAYLHLGLNYARIPLGLKKVKILSQRFGARIKRRKRK